MALGAWVVLPSRIPWRTTAAVWRSDPELCSSPCSASSPMILRLSLWASGRGSHFFQEEQLVSSLHLQLLKAVDVVRRNFCLWNSCCHIYFKHMNTDLITSQLHFLFFISVENQSTPDSQTHSIIFAGWPWTYIQTSWCLPDDNCVYNFCLIKPDRLSEPINSKTEKGNTVVTFFWWRLEGSWWWSVVFG